MNNGQKRLGLVVEGQCERAFFENDRIRQWFHRRGFVLHVIQAQGRPNLLQKARSQLEILRRKRCDLVIFLLDQDMDDCPPETAAKLDVVRRESDVIVAVAARTFESWLLADIEGVQDATGESFAGLPTDGVSAPDEELKSLFRRKTHSYLTKTEIVRRMARYFSFDRAMDGNHSVQRFVDRLLRSTNPQ